MMYDTMFNVAQDIAAKKQSTGYVSPDDTVCVICAASKRVYTGVNHTEMQNGMMVNVHAEIDAIQQMRAGGDTVAENLLLIGVMTRQPILPCNGCIGFILAQNPANANCQIVLPDRMIPITQVGQATGSVPFNAAAPVNSSYANSMPFNGAAPVNSGYVNSVPYNSAAPVGSSGYSTSMPYNGAQPTNGGGHYVGVSVPAQSKAKNANAGYLKNKAGALMKAGDDIGKDDDDDDDNSFFSKLFKK